MRNLFLLLPLAASLVACHHNDPDVEPTPLATKFDKLAANYDVLANANGHWRWIRTAYPFGQWRDSAYIGYGRQLLFKSDSSVVLRRTAMPDYSSPYTFAISNNVFRCDAYGRKRVYFNTGENQLPANNRYKTVRLFPASQGLSLSLQLTQDGECLDSGGIEVYFWVNEK